MLPVILVAVGAYLIGDSVIKDSKKYAKGGDTFNAEDIYKMAEEMTDAEYDKKYSKLTEKEKASVKSLIRLGDEPKLALATIYMKKDEKEDSDTWNLYKYAKGGNTDTMKNIKDYYTNKYPTDELGVEINEKATFNGLYKVLDNEGDVYHYIGVQDSLVRERLFEKLSELMGVEYNVIYKKWLASDFEPMFDKGGEIKSGDKFYDKNEKQTIEVLKKADNFDFYYIKWQDGLETPYTTSNIQFLVEKGLWKKMEQGGYMAKGGDLSSIKKKYEKNEDENAHSENVVLLAKNFGTDEDLAEAKRILALHNKEGKLSSENGKKRRDLHLKLIEKARAEMDKQGIEFEKGGYMAKGGKTAKNRIKRDGEHLMHFEPYFEKEVIVASIDDKAKTIRPSQGYFYPNAIGKKSINWAKKNGFKFIQDGKEF